MKFLLVEGIDDVQRQFSYIPKEDFYKIISMDPTYKENSNSVGKYGKWLLGLFNKLSHAYYESPERENNEFILQQYDEIKNNPAKQIEKDIGKFKSFIELSNAINSSTEKELSSRQQLRRDKNASSMVGMLFDGQHWKISWAKNYAGAITLGKGTTWCTADSRNAGWYCKYVMDYQYYDSVEFIEVHTLLNSPIKEQFEQDWLQMPDVLYNFNCPTIEDVLEKYGERAVVLYGDDWAMIVNPYEELDWNHGWNRLIVFEPKDDYSHKYQFCASSEMAEIYDETQYSFMNEQDIEVPIENIVYGKDELHEFFNRYPALFSFINNDEDDE